MTRLRQRRALRVLDLFAGCGGLSLGFRGAGCDIVGSIERDAKAAQSHAMNFFGESHPRYEVHRQAQDITHLPPSDFARSLLGVNDGTNQVDIIVGGPPCQAFARIGRAKLREIMEDPDAHLNDGRASLYVNFLEYVEYFRPLAVLMENVPEIMRHGGKNVAEEIAISLDNLGYRTRYTILNAVHYGVPQFRQRVFILALLDALDLNPEFPSPTHAMDLPDGYIDARHSALRGIEGGGRQITYLEDGNRNGHYAVPPEPLTDLPNAVTAGNAMADLPQVFSEQILNGVKPFTSTLAYHLAEPHSDYARNMRTWPDFVSANGVVDHVTRYLPRDYRIFRRMQAGDEYPRAFKIAEQLFKKALRNYASYHGHTPRSDTLVHQAMKKRFVPPYDPGKFPNKWCKMDENRPARTLTAHLGKDSYTHIHYDSDQARTITVREAARLQSFPDGFRFEGPMNPAFRQIGNAVPPLLALALATQIRELINHAVRNVAAVTAGMG